PARPAASPRQPCTPSPTRLRASDPEAAVSITISTRPPTIDERSHVTVKLVSPVKVRSSRNGIVRPFAVPPAAHDRRNRDPQCDTVVAGGSAPRCRDPLQGAPPRPPEPGLPG